MKFLRSITLSLIFLTISFANDVFISNVLYHDCIIYYRFCFVKPYSGNNSIFPITQNIINLKC